MKRILNRWLIRMRWVMLWTSTLLVLTLILSGFVSVKLVSEPNSFDEVWGVAITRGHVALIGGSWGSSFAGDPCVSFESDRPAWRWWPDVLEVRLKAGSLIATLIPIWMVALPLLGLALAGFAAKRRQRTPGVCRFCRYTLAGAAICPECGTPAPTS